MVDNDVKALLHKIKKNIAAIENGDVKDALLDEIRSDFLSWIELVKLFLISERDTYYGYFLMNMQFRVDFSIDSIAGIKLNEFPPVFETNPLLLCKFTLKEIIYIVCHEIDHVILNHPAEMLKANPDGDESTFYEFNLAADAAVNDRLDYEIISEKHEFMSQPDGSITSKSLDRIFKLYRSIKPMEHYAYYFDLIRGRSPKKDSKHGNKKKGDGYKSIMEKQNEKDRIFSDSGSSDNTKQIVTAQSCGGKISDHNWEAGDDAEEAEAAVREFVNAAFDMMSDETRGMMPGNFISTVQEINKPPVISWQTVLKKYVGTIAANKRKTRTRLNRRQPERFDISGSIDDKILKIVVAIDTSASMDNQTIGQIFSEIFAILAKRKYEITVIECDDAVQRVYKAKTQADIQKKIAGRGGTGFTPVIDYINNDKYFRDALLIYFTDGYGEDEIPRPRTYRNMWVVLNNTKYLSISNPYGTVLAI